MINVVYGFVIVLNLCVPCIIGNSLEHWSAVVTPYDDPELIELINRDSKVLTLEGRTSSIETNLLPSVLDTSNDTELIEQASMDRPWQQFIVSGPMTVNLLGQLMVISSKLDFSFLDIMPNHTFVYMKYPSSFRATLTQISNHGWKAFHDANSNMKKIEIYMELIPGHIKTVLKILGGRVSSHAISNLLPRALREIEKIGKNCVNISIKTHMAFLDVMELLAEVISTTETSRGLYDRDARRITIELNVSRVMQQQLEKIGETIKSHYDEVREAVRTAQSQYSQALNNIPTGFKGLLIELGRAVIGVVSSVTKKIFNVNENGSGPATNAVAAGQSLAFGRLLFDSATQLSQKVNNFLSSYSSEENKTSSYSGNPLEEFDAYKVVFNTYLASIKSGETTELKSKVKDFIEEAISITEKVLSLAKKVIGSGAKIESSTADSLQEEISALITKVKPIVAAESLDGASTGSFKPSGGASNTNVPLNNEQFAVQMASERLKDAEKQYNTIFIHLKQQQEEMGKLISKIAHMDIQRINYIELLQLLREALLLLGKVREQWNQLVLFFAEIAARSEIALSGTLGPFIEQATLAGSSALTNDDRLFYTDLLKSQAVAIHKESFSLFIMSRTYVDMSEQFIMKQLAGITQMLQAESNEERSELLLELNRQTKYVQDKVISVVNERRLIYTASIEKRRKELDKFMDSLGGADPTDQEAIEEAKAILKTV